MARRRAVIRPVARIAKARRRALRQGRGQSGGPVSGSSGTVDSPETGKFEVQAIVNFLERSRKSRREACARTLVAHRLLLPWTRPSGSPRGRSAAGSRLCMPTDPRHCSWAHPPCTGTAGKSRPTSAGLGASGGGGSLRSCWRSGAAIRPGSAGRSRLLRSASRFRRERRRVLCRIFELPVGLRVSPFSACRKALFRGGEVGSSPNRAFLRGA